MKIKTRFTLLFTFIVGIMLSFFSIAILYLSEEYRQEDFHSRLKNRAIEKLELLNNANEESNSFSSKKPLEEKSLHSLSDEQIAIYDENKNLIYTSDKLHPINSKLINCINGQGNYTWSKGNIEGYGFKHTEKEKKYFLFASATDIHGISYINNLKRILSIRLFIIILIVFLSGWTFARYFIRPIADIVNQAKNITSKNLSYRLKSKYIKDEIGQLTTAFNQMLGRLETAFTIQKRFVSNASHELRNPLTAISGQIDVALMKDRKKEEYRATLESVSTHIRNLRTLSNNLLELANTDVDYLFQNFDELRIDEILWDIQDEIKKQKSDCNIKVIFENITDDERKLSCKGNSKLLETAFINIIDNACKYSEDKTVEIKVVSERKNIVLFFTDHGIGMPEAYLNHIFEPFYRGDNTHGIPGKGIGLSLVKGIIKIHSGKVFIRSVLNEGTTVEIVLPNLS